MLVKENPQNMKYIIYIFMYMCKLIVDFFTHRDNNQITL